MTEPATEGPPKAFTIERGLAFSALSTRRRPEVRRR